MFVWVGAVVEDDFAYLLNDFKGLGKHLNFDERLFEMPLHISFKISFEIEQEQFEHLVETVEEFYSTLHSFSLCVRGVENVGEIVWVRYNDEPYLSQIKDKLNALLLQKFNIQLHEYDLDFLFHTSLFMSNDLEKNKRAFDALQNFAFPQQVHVNKFALGRAERNEIGEFKVFKTFEVRSSLEI